MSLDLELQLITSSVQINNFKLADLKGYVYILTLTF